MTGYDDRLGNDVMRNECRHRDDTRVNRKGRRGVLYRKDYEAVVVRARRTRGRSNVGVRIDEERGVQGEGMRRRIGRYRAVGAESYCWSGAIDAWMIIFRTFRMINDVRNARGYNCTAIRTPETTSG